MTWQDPVTKQKRAGGWSDAQRQGGVRKTLGSKTIRNPTRRPGEVWRGRQEREAGLGLAGNSPEEVKGQNVQGRTWLRPHGKNTPLRTAGCWGQGQQEGEGKGDRTQRNSCRSSSARPRVTGEGMLVSHGEERIWHSLRVARRGTCITPSYF